MNPQTQSIANHQLVDPCQGCVYWLSDVDFGNCPSIANVKCSTLSRALYLAKPKVKTDIIATLSAWSMMKTCNLMHNKWSSSRVSVLFKARCAACGSDFVESDEDRPVSLGSYQVPLSIKSIAFEMICKSSTNYTLSSPTGTFHPFASETHHPLI
jgi:hypothetical protein